MLAATRSGLCKVETLWKDHIRQTKADKDFDLTYFQIDWHKKLIICPQGNISARWSRAGERMVVVFAPEGCAGCPIHLVSLPTKS